jgi:putative transposase
MPWKETNVMDQKKEFVLEALKGNMNFTSLCAKYCISPKTGYKWKQRFLVKRLIYLRKNRRLVLRI